MATPALIGAASLAGRRWGPAVSGSLVGLPLTSGPLALFLALDHGPTFAAASALGTLAGTISVAAFALAYAWLALRSTWPVSLAGGLLAFALATHLLQFQTLPAGPLAALVTGLLSVALLLMPRPGENGPLDEFETVPPDWDIPARMLVATAFVLMLTALAIRLGPQLTGLLSPFPLYTAVLGIFAHAWHGQVAAVRLLRGTLFGVYAFVGFFVVVTVALQREGLFFTFAAATAAAVLLQSASLWLIRARRPVLGHSRPEPESRAL